MALFLMNMFILANNVNPDEMRKLRQVFAFPRENLLQRFAKNKVADQPVHLHSLISDFVIYLLESIISKLATIDISLF